MTAFKPVVVFDLDDTLYYEQDFVFSAYRHIARTIARYLKDEREEDFDMMGKESQITSSMIDAFINKKDSFAVANSIAGKSFPLNFYLESYRFHSPDIVLPEESMAILKKLKSEGYVLGLISDGRKITQRNKINSLGLYTYINSDDMVISEEFGSEKPDKKNFKYFMDKYPSAPYYVYVADNPGKDFVAPNSLGWRTIGLRDIGRNIHPQIIDVDSIFLPSIWIDSLTELESILQTFQNL